MSCFSSCSPVSIVGLLQLCILCQIQGIIDKPFQPAARSSNFFSVTSVQGEEGGAGSGRQKQVNMYWHLNASCWVQTCAVHVDMYASRLVPLMPREAESRPEL